MAIEYKIKKGDKFVCLKDYVMDNGDIAYSKGNDYISEYNDAITDNNNDKLHIMINQDDFFEYFELVAS